MGADALSRRSGLLQCPGLTSPPTTVVTPARNTSSLPARLPLLHVLKLHYKIPVVVLLVSYRKSFGVMSPSLSFTLWSCYAAKRRLLHSFVFVICFLCGWRAGISCEHVAFWHCRAAMLHQTLVRRSPLSFLSPRYNPGCHRLRSRVTFMLEEYQAVIATIIRSPGASSKRLAFAFFCKVLGQVRSVQLTPHIRRLPNLCQDGLRCLLVLCWGVNLARLCRCFFHAYRPRTARGHMPARQLDEFIVGVVIHVTGWIVCATCSYFLVVHCFFWRCPSMRVYVQAPTTVFNECYVSHRRFAKDLCAPVPCGLEFPPVVVVFLFGSCH